MDQETFSLLLQGENCNQDSLDQLDQLVKKYPYFNLARLLRLKVAHSAGIELKPDEISRASIYTNNRKFLYNWMRGDVDTTLASGLLSNEIEFIDERGSAEEEGDDIFELIDESDINDDEEIPGVPNGIDVRAYSEKDEADMEHPEIEDEIPVPVIEAIEEDSFDEEFEDRKENKQSEVISVEENENKQEKVRSGVEKLQYASSDFLLTKESHDSPTEEDSLNLIEQFLESDGGHIQADQETSLQGDISTESVREDDSFITDTLAKIYIKQGLHAKAIYAYERLSLKYPEKSAYFAAQIEKVKNIFNI